MTRTRLSRFVSCAIATLLGLGCIGRPIIGERDPDEADRPGACEDDELSCDDWGGPPAFPEPAASSFTARKPCSDEVQEMRLAAGADGLARQVRDLDVSCATLKLIVEDAAEVILTRPVLDRARLEITSEGTATVTIVDARGNGASIVLDGTSTLVLREWEQIADLRVDAGSDARGWDVTIERSSLTGPRIRIGVDATLLVRDTSLERPQLSAGAGLVSFQNATLDAPVLDAKQWIAAGTDVNAGDIRARRGSFVAGTMTKHVKLAGCESFVMDKSKVEDSDLGPCSAGPRQIWNTSIDRSILRGRVFAAQSWMTECILGAEDGASLSLFESTIKWSVLCDVEALSARGGSVLFCARCDPDSPRAACISNSAIAVVHCPTLAAASACDEPLPASLLEPPTSDAGPDATMSAP